MLKSLLIIFSLFLSFPAWSAEPVQNPIEQAQALAIKKNRLEASTVLLRAITALPSGAKSRAKMIEALNTIARVFFTDKGQKLFEVGQSMMFETPDVALSRYREALALEDNNILVLNSIARVQISKQDCAGGLATLKSSNAISPFYADTVVLELRAHVCEKDFEAFRERLKTLPPLDKNQEAFVQYLLAQDFLRQKMWRKANEILLKVSQEQPRFPEVYYSLLKAGEEMDHEDEGFAQKYVSLCKAVGPRERKQFALEPRLCANAKEVEDELAKKSTDI